MNRGDLYTAPSGAVGRYVGERAGWSPDMGAVIVVAYEGDNFAAMCAAFDRWERSDR